MNNCWFFFNICFSPFPPLIFEFSIPKLTLLSLPSGLNEIVPMLNSSEGWKLITWSPGASRRGKCLLLEWTAWDGGCSLGCPFLIPRETYLIMELTQREQSQELGRKRTNWALVIFLSSESRLTWSERSPWTSKLSESTNLSRVSYKLPHNWPGPLSSVYQVISVSPRLRVAQSGHTQGCAPSFRLWG